MMILKLVNKLLEHVAVRFVISGGTSAVVDLFVLFLLHTVFEVHYLTSAILAFVVAFGVSFTLHKFWTFKSHGESAKKQMALYLMSSLFGLFLNTLLMYVFVDYLFKNILLDHMDIKVLGSQIIVGLIVAVVSFFLSRQFVFKYKKQDTIEIQIT